LEELTETGLSSIVVNFAVSGEHRSFVSVDLGISGTASAKISDLFFKNLVLR